MIPSIFDIGVDAADYVAPSPVSYTNWDLCEGLPDEELTEVCFTPDFSAFCGYRPAKKQTTRQTKRSAQRSSAKATCARLSNGRRQPMTFAIYGAKIL